MTVNQSREYQVKFCHANITHHRTESATPYVSAYRTDETIVAASSTPNILDAINSAENGEAQFCNRILKKCSIIHRLIIVIGTMIVILLIIAVILIAVLNRA